MNGVLHTPAWACRAPAASSGSNASRIRCSLLRCENCSTTAQREAGSAELPAKQRRQETAEAVGLDGDRGEVQSRREFGHLAAQLGGLVGLFELSGVVAQIAHGRAASSRPRHRRTPPRPRWRRRLRARRRRGPTSRWRRPSPPGDGEAGLAVALAVVERAVVADQARRIEPHLLEAARLQHHLALELGRPGVAADLLDLVHAEPLRPAAAAAVVEDRDAQPRKPVEERPRLAALLARRLGVDRVVAVRRADVELQSPGTRM